MRSPNGYEYRPYPDARSRIESAHFLTKRLIELLKQHPDELSSYAKEFLKIALWKITEAETRKYQTRFCSMAIWESKDWLAKNAKDRQKNACHDHVFRSEIVIPKLLEADESEIDGLLTQQVGCVVTEEEHNKLSANDKRNIVDGWDRYVREGIEVVDASTGLLYRPI